MCLKAMNVVLLQVNLYNLSRGNSLSTRLHVHPAKTQISLSVRADSSESLLSACGRFGRLASIRVPCKDSDGTGRIIYENYEIFKLRVRFSSI